ncbi:hypothetical conserved protein [Oceanobacillus iheyensis HTE831]|uniref:Hypothetical conserved protein n=1 Tax=Oceanobacillus iheyensis (strain DSM 14371 / CIP 107618 / JCM 11309 / KCTC 3954 / HTE831) TaxID=221109 RepID=Q8ETU4_OCEIH|nr:efflux RND transporter periplasmic adaptor subunit [Oceanobacillus iheyensis]BAC12117.1 hypothetical conserved protein [Oceanobacillus iheyensis HTE831]
MKKKKVFVIIFIVLIAGLIIVGNIWNASADSKIEVEVTQLEEETITETVMTSGQLKLAEQQTIYYTPENGEVEEILVNEGDQVESGTPLIFYENTQLDLEQDQNELQLQSANLKVNDLRKQHEVIDDLLRDDEKNEQLQAEHDNIKLQEQQAYIEVEQLQLQKESLQDQINDLEIKSEIAGKVLEVNDQVVVGSNQMEQQPIIRIGTLDQMIIEGFISEYDSLKIEEGNPVTLSSDTVPNQTWEGEVSFISDLPKEIESSGTNGGGGVQYPIEITVASENINLKPGFQIIVEITTDERIANTLPITSIKQNGQTNYVHVVNNGKVESREVGVNTASKESIEITDGVTNEDLVIKDQTDTIEDGMDVSIK